MKSVIKIDIDPEGLPVLRVKLATDQTDVRDKLLNRFFRHTETSNLLTFKITSVEPPITIGGGHTDIEIYPVKELMLSDDGKTAFSPFEVLPVDFVRNITVEYDTSKG
jgi:hypothetical protein